MKHRIIIVILLITLTACSSAQPSADVANTAMAIVQTGAALTPTVTVVVSTPSPLPTEPIIPMITPDAIQVERWREYQTELAKSVLPYDPSPIVLCEWAILGQSNQEVYIWAVCEGVARTSAPVIIYLNIDGTIQQVKAVGYDATRNIQIQKLFPLDIQEKIFSELVSNLDEQLTRHLSQRSGYPESLPLIILLATPTATVVYPTPSPFPTLVPFPIFTPDAVQVERWKEYENALAKALVRSSFIPDQFLCEWEILGRSAQETYVWMICASIFSTEVVGDTLAVIHIGTDGTVQSVETPAWPLEGGVNWGANIRRMFPLYVQERYFSGLIHFQELNDHLRWRHEHPEEPPLIILSTTPTVTPTP